jgi:hypothetical protein
VGPRRRESQSENGREAGRPARGGSPHEGTRQSRRGLALPLDGLLLHHVPHDLRGHALQHLHIHSAGESPARDYGRIRWTASRGLRMPPIF